jgi:hypothetical protein
VAFLEAFTMSSTPQFVDQDATMSIRGNVFDVADSFRLVEDKYPASMPPEDRPAVVLAPVLGRLRSATVSESKLEILARQALDQNRLAEFDPSTAWGGNFMIYGPEEKMEAVNEYVIDGRVQEIITGPDFLDADNTTGVETVDVQMNQLVTPELDDLYMWGMLWNPEMPALEDDVRTRRAAEKRGANRTSRERQGGLERRGGVGLLSRPGQHAVTMSGGIREAADRLGTDAEPAAVAAEIKEWEAALVRITSQLELDTTGVDVGTSGSERLSALQRRQSPGGCG